MHPKMMQRNVETFRQKFKGPDKGAKWAKAHMRVRFSDEERAELLKIIKGEK